MQQSQPSPSRAGAPPQVAAPPGAANAKIPASNAEYRAVDANRDALTAQLRRAESRAQSLIAEMGDAPAEARQLLADQLKVVNEGIVQLESQLAFANWQLASTPPALITVPQVAVPRPRRTDLSSDQITAISIVAIVMIGFPIALAMARRLWRRGTRAPESARDLENGQRLRRMEHAMDAVAIEVERISEGQRFLTQIFAQEQKRAQLPATEPLRDERH
jgi:hypothetical protein